MSGRMKQLCDCGCGREVYHNQLKEIKVEEAIDETLRQSQTKARFWVTPQCVAPYTEELKLMTCLQIIVQAHPPSMQTRYWLINAWLNPFYPWPRILRSWWRRVGGALRVMKLQHAIWERTKGFDYARTRAKQSAVLFGAPRFMQGFLARRYTKRLAAQNKKPGDGAAASEQETEQTSAPCPT